MKQKIDLFIPALALQHPTNPENCDLKCKIRLAVLRYWQSEDFNSILQVVDPTPLVILKETLFNKGKLGYDVKGYIR